MQMTPLRVALALLCSLSSTAFANGQEAQRDPQLREGESVFESRDEFPGAELRDGDGDARTWCVRIIDAFDQRPIAGARVEVPAAAFVAGELHFQCTAVADRFGWARLPWPAVWGHHDYVFADAPGYAADEECYPGNDECALRRGVDVPIEVVDYTGLPVGGARVELVLGCGHVPPQRTVVTDADGRATLPDIQPSRHEDVFVWSPRCIYGAYRLRSTWRPGCAPVVIDVVPGVVAKGRVLDAQRRPVVGALVGKKGGLPCVRTDRDGAFELMGLAPWSELEVTPPPMLGLANETFTAPPVGVARTIVLGATEELVTLPVTTAGPDGVAAVDVHIAAVRDADGLTVTGYTDEAGTAKLSVAPGHYRVFADGQLGEWGRCEVEVDVASGSAATVAIPLPRNPTVKVDASRVEDMRIGLTTAEGYRELFLDGKADVDVPVPVGQRATFRVSCDEHRELLVRFFDVPAPGGKVVLDGPPVTRLRARCVDPDGETVEASLRIERQIGAYSFDHVADEFASEPVATTRLSGAVTWVVLPEREDLLPRMGELVLGEDGGEIDLGELQLQAFSGPELKVELPDDLMPADGWVRVALARANAFFASSLEEDGTAIGLGAAVAGDRLQVTLDAEGVLPFSYLVPGPPPWTVPWPSASLRLTLRDAGGAPLTDGSVIVDGTVVSLYEEVAGELRLRAIEPGLHTLVVAQRDHLVKAYTLRFAADEERALDVQLTER